MKRLNTIDRYRLIGERVYLARTARRLAQSGISQRIAATHGEAFRVSQRRISEIETGKAKYVDVLELELIAAAMNESISEFLKP